MSLKSIVLPALALVGAASAACSNTATFTIQNAGDAAALATCTTFSGSIAIQTGVTSDISISGVKAITGDLIADNTVGLPSLEAPTLESIGGTFGLTNMTLLTGLTFPRLSTVGQLLWTTLPRLNSLTFTTGIKQATTVKIFDSQLGSLDGINLESVDEFVISNNNQLNDIEMQVSEITTAFQVEFNGRNMSVMLPNLEVAYNMTFRNVSKLSMPSLSAVNDTLGFYGCNFDTFSAPNLTTGGGSISFIGNNKLTNISMPQLESLRGALQLSANALLQEIDGFPALAQVGGAVDCNGNFTDVNLPALKNVAGACNLQSTATIDTTCTRFQPLKDGGVIQGEYTCEGKQASPGGVGTSTTSGTSTSSQSGAAARDMFARSSAVTGIVGVLAALFGML